MSALPTAAQLSVAVDISSLLRENYQTWLAARGSQREPDFDSGTSIRPGSYSVLDDPDQALREFWRVPTREDLDPIATALVISVPDDEEDTEELTRAVAEVRADPESRNFVERVSDRLKKSREIRELEPWMLLVLIAWLIYLMARISPTDLAALALIYAVASDVFKGSS